MLQLWHKYNNNNKHFITPHTLVSIIIGEYIQILVILVEFWLQPKSSSQEKQSVNILNINNYSPEH